MKFFNLAQKKKRNLEKKKLWRLDFIEMKAYQFTCFARNALFDLN